MAYYLKDFPFTEEGKKLNLADEERERFRLVYKKKGEGWILHDIWGEGDEYGDDCIVVPLQSSYRGHWILNPGQEFANVAGSGDDRPPAGIGSWIGLWKYIYRAVKNEEPPTICCTDGGEYQGIYFTPNFCDVQNPQCLDGGHVILGTESKRADEGHLVYIVPICRRHNCMNWDGHEYFNNIYMKIGLHPTFAVLLSYSFDRLRNDYFTQHLLEAHEKI